MRRAVLSLSLLLLFLAVVNGQSGGVLVGKASYPFGVCGLSLLCLTTGTTFTNFTTPCTNALCTSGGDAGATCSVPGTNAFCSCSNPCLRGPICSLVVAPSQVQAVPAAGTPRQAGVCYADAYAALTPCNATFGGTCPGGTYCLRQMPFPGTPLVTTYFPYVANVSYPYLGRTFATSGALSIQHAVADVCCPLGFTSDECNGAITPTTQTPAQAGLGYSGRDASLPLLTWEPPQLATKRLTRPGFDNGQIVGPGICNATLLPACDTTTLPGFAIPTGVCGTPAVSNPPSDYTCNLVDPGARCNPHGAGCLCADPCLTGPLCTIAKTPISVPLPLVCTWTKTDEVNYRPTFQATFPVNATDYATFGLSRTTPMNNFYARGGAIFTSTYYWWYFRQTCVPTPRTPGACYADMVQPPLCAAFGPAGCPVNTQCVRTTNGRGDVCCPRGRVGDLCEVPTGCTLGGCSHNTTCTILDPNRPIQTARCTGCPVAIYNATDRTLLRAGYVGTWCDTPAPPTKLLTEVVTPQTAPVRRRLLSAQVFTQIVAQPGNQIARVCDCGVAWSPPVPADGSLPVMQVGNHKGAGLLTRANPFALSDVQHRPVWFHQAQASLQDARANCHADAYCLGLYTWMVSGVPRVAYATNATLFQTQTPNLASLLSLTPNATFLALRRDAHRLACSSSFGLDAAFYWGQNAPDIRAAFAARYVSSVDTTQLPSNATRAEWHWRLFGHVEQRAPNAACQATVPLIEYALYCNASEPLQAVVVANGSYIVTQTLDQPVQTTMQVRCSADGTTLVNRTTTVYGAVVVTEYSFVNQTVLRNFTVPSVVPSLVVDVSLNASCTTPLPPDSTSVTVVQTTAVQVGRIDQTCGPMALVDASDFDANKTGLSAAARSGVVVYSNARLQCGCAPPFVSSNATGGYDCADTACGAGWVNTSWANGFVAWPPPTAQPQACTCRPGFYTLPSTCNMTHCDWCGFQSNCSSIHGGILSLRDGSCRCTNPVFTGPRCDTPTCVASNTANVSATGVCQCQPGFAGVYCEIECHFGMALYATATSAPQCVCNQRQGYWGPTCNLPLCNAGRPVFTSATALAQINNTAVADKDIATCVCPPPFSGLLCDQHTCNTSAWSTRVGWSATLPFGLPVLDNDATTHWRCQCNYPFRGANGSLFDCSDHACGPYGVPSYDMTPATLAQDRCTCRSTGSPSLEIRTQASDCNGTVSCTRACAFGTCGVNSTLFGLSPLCPLPGSANGVGCVCSSAVLAYNGSSCSTSCAYVQPCLPSNITHQVLKADGTCGCESNYSPRPGFAPPDCGLYTPDAPQPPPLPPPDPVVLTYPPDNSTVAQGSGGGGSSSTANLFAQTWVISLISSLGGIGVVLVLLQSALPSPSDVVSGAIDESTKLLKAPKSDIPPSRATAGRALLTSAMRSRRV